MKSIKITIAVLLTLIGYTSFAQQVPLYGQYYFNRFLYNPALAGESGRTEAYLMGRRQWTALDGYQTRAVTLSGSPTGTNVGLGIYYVNDVNNIAVANNVYGNYAYKVKLNEGSELDLGFNIGVYDYRFNMQNIVLADMNDAAVALLNNDAGPVVDAGAGIAYKNKGFMIGAAVPQLINGPIIYKDNYISSIEHDLESHYQVMTSVDIKVGKNAKLQPMVMYKGVKNAPGQIDANLMFEYIDKAWLGAAYRDDYAVTMMGGVTISNMIRMGYAYDWSVSGYNTALGGSHELMFGVSLNNKVSDEDRLKEEQERLRKEAEAQFRLDSMLMERDDRIDELKQEVKDLENAPNRVDTVVIVKKIETPVIVQAPEGTEPSTGAGSGTTTPVVEKPKVETPKQTTPRATTPAGGKFMVVVGSFTEKKNADRYMGQLSAQGINAYGYVEPGSGRQYVHLGRFDKKSDARAKVAATNSDSVNPWIKAIK